MKILVDIGHPAHVHQFKYFIREMEKKGHDVKITVREKNLNMKLLDAYGFSYENIGKSRKGIVKKTLGTLITDQRLLDVAKNFKADVLIGGSGNLYVAHVGKILRKKSIIFEDTEHAKEQIMLYLPFVDVVVTPSCFLKDLGPKQIRYDGYHELAYIHPNWFTPDPTVLDELNVSKGDNYVIIRFVSWGASHDTGHVGFTTKGKIKLIKEIEKYAKPIITSEGRLPKELHKYMIKIPPHRIHDVMYYAKMYAGEGATMASEAACLGTPAIYVNTLTAGTLMEQGKYHLIFEYRNSSGVLEKAIELLNTPNLKDEWKNRRDKMLSEKIDVTTFMVWFIENYTRNSNTMKENPEYQQRFR